ncbi:MAG: carboxymuconolactone decarboxylase family protein [Halioglobus sp.]
MPFIDTVPVAQCSGQVKNMYLRQQASWGFVPNYAKVFSHRPELMKAWAGLLHCLEESVDQQTFDLVTLAASQALGSSYCALAYGRKLESRCFEADDLADIVNNEMSEHLSPAQQAMMQLAKKVATNSASISQSDINVLRHLGYSDDTVFDIMAIASARCFFATLVDSLGVRPDSDFKKMPATLRDALCVGRPISNDQAEQLV